MYFSSMPFKVTFYNDPLITFIYLPSITNFSNSLRGNTYVCCRNSQSKIISFSDTLFLIYRLNTFNI